MIKIILRNIKNILVGWCIAVPLSLIIPKQKNLVLFMGRFQGKFFGNVKSLYLYLNKLKENDIKYLFFTEHNDVYRQLRNYNLPAIKHPSFLSLWTLLRANVIIASSTAWIKKCKYHLLFRSKKVQIFHGLALKKVELGITKKTLYNRTYKGKLDNILRGRFPRYDLLISSSPFFTENLFKPSFNTIKIIECGFPRNDLFFKKDFDELELLGADTETIFSIQKRQKQGCKVVIYAPTFRDTTGDAVSDNILDMDTLSAFADEHNMVFVFKFHISTDLHAQIKSYNNIFVYNNSSDIQPVLKISDLLITDYSSVCIDYLLTNKPMLFFPYDREKYVKKDREFLCDYDSLTAGPKCYTQTELLDEINKNLKGIDEYSEARQKLKELSFTDADGNASERVWNLLKKTYF